MNFLKKNYLIEKLANKQITILIFLLALFARFIIISYLVQERQIYEYEVIAINLVTGKGFSMQFFPYTKVQETCMMAPIYCFFLAFFFLIFGINDGAILAVQIVQSFIGAFTIFPVYYLTRKYFSHKVAVLSCLLFAFYPDFLYSVYVIHPLTIITFLIPITIYLTCIFKEKPTYKKAIFLGILYGFSLLVEPILTLMFCFLLFWIFICWSSKRFRNENFSLFSLKRRIKFISLIILFCALVIIPWLIRCYIVYDGHFVFIKSNGYNFYRGHNSYYTETGIPPEYYHREEDTDNERKLDQMYFNMAIEYIVTHIPETIFNTFRKFIDFWWFPVVSPEQSPLIRIICYSPLLLLFISGLYYNRKQLKEIIPLIIPLLSFTLIYSISFVLPRYRVPIQPIIFIFSAYTLEKYIEIIFNKLTSKKKTL